MFSKLFSLFSLKRKFPSTEETDTSVNESSSRPTKRVRIEESSSTNEDQTEQPIPVQDACTTDDDDEEEELEVCDEILPRGMKGKEVERLEDLEEEVREARAIAARLREETRNYVESIDRAMNCVVCYDFIRNPQVLSECGHTVCYPCLRTWFTRDPEDPNPASMISTDEESDGDEKDDKEPGSSKATTPPPRHRHRFHSVTNRKKVCPECSIVITRRPRPLFRLRLLADVINGAESPIPSSVIHPRPKIHKVSKRRDLWHGIFHAPGDEQERHNRIGARAQGRRDAELERLRWRAAMDEAHEEGRRQMMAELRRERTEYNEERRRRPFNLFSQRAQDEPMERVRAPLPRRAFPTIPQPTFIPGAQPFSSPPSPSAYRLVFGPQPPQPNPPQLNEFVSGPDALPPPPSHPIFQGPPPSQAGPSNSTQPPPPRSASIHDTPTPSNQRSSTPTILESLRLIRRQFHSTPSADPEDVDELADDEYESGDEDLPLFIAMMQANNPTPAPQYHREYPVYVEDLVLEEDMEVDIHLDEGDGSVGSLAQREDQGLHVPAREVEAAGENPVESIGRAMLMRQDELEDQGGVDLE